MESDRRRYRFRIWHPDEQKMYPVISLTRGGIVVQDDDMTKTCLRDAVVLMQYTALVDSQNKEIYEGDVVAGGDEDYEVQFSGGGFRLRSTNKTAELNNQPLTEDIVSKHGLKVHGNIHQPDLYQANN